jgi:hypothetical protein
LLVKGGKSGKSRGLHKISKKIDSRGALKVIAYKNYKKPGYVVFGYSGEHSHVLGGKIIGATYLSLKKSENSLRNFLEKVMGRGISEWSFRKIFASS